MGETRVGERILGSYTSGEACCSKNSYTFKPLLSGYLHSFSADKLKYFHNKAFGYDANRNSVNLGGAWMVKNMDGEK